MGDPYTEQDNKVPPINPNGRSAGQLMKEITEDLSTLFRKEIELAKQEVSKSVSAKLQGAAIIAIAAAMGFFALIFVQLALRDGLDRLIGNGTWTWLADLITAAILLLIGVVGALVARKKLSTPISTELTKKTVKDDIEWAKSIGKR